MMTTGSPSRAIFSWLFLLLVLLLVMILLGGYTRLVGAGLSIVEWAPFKGILPPLSPDAWESAFAAYQATPEYMLINKGISLGSFQHLFWVEYTHRLLGRLIGVVFFAPLLYWGIRKKLPSLLYPPLAWTLALGLFQGLMGWLMVKSGLQKEPYVSPLCLAFHLMVAVTLVSLLFEMQCRLRPPPKVKAPHLFRYARVAFALALVTLFYGALVAGSKAGWIYNTFPFMGDDVLPPDAWALKPIWHNFFQNPTMIQFMHRILGMLTFTSLVGVFYVGRCKTRSPLLKNSLTLILTLGMAQVGLGITTLLLQVPLWAALSHQLGGILVALSLLNLLRRTAL